MNKNQFLAQPNLVELFLVGLRAIDKRTIIIQIDNTPDYNITEYRREEDTNYYFHNSWLFGHEFHSLLSANFIETKLYDDSTLRRIASENNIAFSPSHIPKFLNSIYEKDKHIFSQEGFETNIDQFRLNELRVKSIDNVNQRVFYEGSFFGNHEMYDSIDVGLYAKVELLGFSSDLIWVEFYKILIVESYILYKENRYNLALFIAFSAFDSFINYELNSSDKNERLNDKFKLLFKQVFGELKKHQIYSSLMKDFPDFLKKRNAIAHGKNETRIRESEVAHILIFICSMILAYEKKLSTFDELQEQVLKNYQFDLEEFLSVSLRKSAHHMSR